MVASKKLDNLQYSEATLGPKDAEIYLSHLEADGGEWIRYTKKNYDTVKDLAEIFVNNHAKLSFGGVSYFTSQPIHVFRFHRAYTQIEGLIYSNGIIAIYHTDPKEVRLWIDQETVKLFDYPRPRPNDLPS